MHSKSDACGWLIASNKTPDDFWTCDRNEVALLNWVDYCHGFGVVVSTLDSAVNAFSRTEHPVATYLQEAIPHFRKNNRCLPLPPELEDVSGIMRSFVHFCDHSNPLFTLSVWKRALGGSLRDLTPHNAQASQMICKSIRSAAGGAVPVPPEHDRIAPPDWFLRQIEECRSVEVYAYLSSTRRKLEKDNSVRRHVAWQLLSGSVRM